MVASSPAIGYDGTIYFGSYDKYLYAVNPDGSRKWSYKTGGAILSSPIVDINDCIYFGGQDGFFYSLNPDSSLRWQKYIGAEVQSSPTIGSSGNIYFGSNDKSLYAIGVLPEPSGIVQFVGLLGAAGVVARFRARRRR